MRGPHLLPCPLCGGSANLDWTGVAEFYGHAWQTLFVTCNADGSDRHCQHEVSVETDSDATHDRGGRLEDIAARTWNQVAVVMSKSMCLDGGLSPVLAKGLAPTATSAELLDALTWQAAHLASACSTDSGTARALERAIAVIAAIQAAKGNG